MKQLRILAGQIAIPPMAKAEDRNAHLANTARKLREQLTQADYDLVVLPELSSLDYSRDSFANLQELAEDLHGPSFATFSQLAKEFNVYIVYGMARRHFEAGLVKKEEYKIAQVVVDCQGQLVGHYDKLHCAQFGASMEKEYFQGGKHLLVFSVKDIKVAPIICYDIRFPELTRTLVCDYGVELMLHCGAYARDDSFDTWHPFCMTRAIENQIYWLGLNRAGEKFGNSLFCPPWMDRNTMPQVFAPHAECFKSLLMEQKIIQQTRQEYAFLADRLPNYGQLPTTSRRNLHVRK